MLLIIVLAQLLIPLLHGHFGTPKQTGLHVHTALSGVVNSHSDFGFVDHESLSHGHQDAGHHGVGLTSSEPFAVGVEPAIEPLNLSSLLLAVAAVGVSALTLMLLAAMACCASASRRAYRLPPRPIQWRDRINRPPPSQAPPLFF
ncbi:hypothetical protein SAMN05216345_11836 [Cupriavidus sp. YR651]|uniref:hypothetical protein n=1 Tax=Cupriavidus sp. YR651 TaxID=1855315 RepID=UPI0008867BBB|nr:hypothetical protein [Cupriavidus sp. YR651]SDD84827.1 hypothetical protein SAMN05216345_11836 [Cupriavidus sp. YR651]